jgi:hypothetical protein
MKLDCHILSVEDCGDVLRVKLQGKPPKSADWRGLTPQVVEVPNIPTAARSLHVGRRVSITIEPK